jgi:alpha-1,3-rhamnosyl/mannosyltransferase
MRITLSVEALHPQLSGIGRYTWELCKRLPDHADIGHLNFWRGGRLLNDPGRLLLAETERRRPPQLIRWIYHAQGRRALRSTLVHGPNYFLPDGTRSGVITVHDLSVFRYPETHPASRVKSFERHFASSLARARHIITDSETVRRELIADFSVPARSVSAVHLGVNSQFQPRTDVSIKPVISKWGLRPGQFGLSVAALEPRKKITELITAWGRLSENVRRRYPLVLAGVTGWRNKEIHDRIARASSEGWLKHLGYVSDADLAGLYAGARLFIYPSIYEGFGLPPVEAMASGTPVIVANRSCLPEICGDAPRLVEPDDIEAFTSAIEQSLLDDDWRNEAIRRGLARARSFTWDRCLRGTVEVYKRDSGQGD